MEIGSDTCAYPGCESHELMIKFKVGSSSHCYCALHAREIYELGNDEAERWLSAHLAVHRQLVQDRS